MSRLSRTANLHGWFSCLPAHAAIKLTAWDHLNQIATIACASLRSEAPQRYTTTMSYTLAEAATAAGVYKSTVLRAIKSGKVSGSKNEMGEWIIEPAELHRVYPPVARSDADTSATQRHAPDDAVAAADAVLRASMLEERVAELKAALADMRAQRDSWQQVAERLTLPPPAPKAVSVPTVTVVPRRPWWQRLAG
jgi:hypothetical protein